MQVICVQRGEVLVIAIKGRMDHAASPEFDRTFAECRACGRKLFVVDLKELDYISSAGLRSLLAAVQNLKQCNGQMRLCGLDGLVKDVFAASGFDSIFNVYDSLDEAVKFG